MEYASKASPELAIRKAGGPHQLARQLPVAAEDWRNGKAILGWALFIVMVVVALAAAPFFAAFQNRAAARARSCRTV